jgi:hypothetical protein
MRIRIQFEIQGFDDQILKKKITVGIFFLLQKLKASLKDAQATEEALSLQKRTCSIFKNENF